MHHRWYQVTRHVEPCGQVALGYISLDSGRDRGQPVSNEDGSLLAVLHGEIYNGSEHRACLERQGYKFATPLHAEVLLHGFTAEGSRFFRKLNGLFSAVIWDRRHRQLLLVTDRFGMQPLYYTHSGRRLLFATEVKALLADNGVNRSLNMRGMAQFFTYGYFFGNDTLLDAVQVVPAATVLSFVLDDAHLHVEAYWNFDSAVTSLSMATHDYLERLDHAFKAATDRRVSNTPHLGLSLSGGMDARSILGVMDHTNVPLTSISIGVEGCMDHRSAAAMASLAHCKHRSVYLGSESLAQFGDNLRTMVRLTDGHYLDQGIVVPTLSVYREEGIEVLLRGHAGELMHMKKAYAFSLDQQALSLRTETELEDWLFRHLQAYMLEGTHGALLAPQHHCDMSALARDSLRDSLRASQGITSPVQRIAHLFITQRLRRETALSLMIFGSLMQNRLPYLDNELIDILMVTPPELKLDDRIQAHILRKRCPAFLNIINANTGARVGAGPLVCQLTTLRMRILAKLGVRGYQPYERLGLWLRRELRPLVCDTLLSERCLDRGVFHPDTVRSVVNGHLNHGQNHTFLLMALMIFEVGQQELFDRHYLPQHADML
ncbi:MAG: asparagine synthetase B [Candidatus Tectimicrobiota bacterium]